MSVLALILPLGLIVLAALPGHWNPLLALSGVPLNFAFLAFLSVEVFSLDTYRNDGRNRWATGDGADHVLYIATIATAVIASGLFVLMASRKSSRSVVRPTLLLNGAADLILGVLVFVRFATT